MVTGSVCLEIGPSVGRLFDQALSWLCSVCLEVGPSVGRLFGQALSWLCHVAINECVR